MAGNRAIYDRAMEQGREASRQARWDDALKGAVRALQEFPQELEARTLAAVALFNTGKLVQSLQIFEELRSADSANPFYLDYIGRAQEQQGNTAAAVQTYIALADMQASRKLGAKTVEALREVLRLRPELDEQRLRLARLLEDASALAPAAAEYLQLARNAQARGQLDAAAEHAETALRLDGQSREAKDMLAALSGAMAAAAGIESAPSPAANEAGPAFRPSLGGMTGALRSQQFTLEKQIAQAIERQEAGDNAAALELYEGVVAAGLERADVLYSLGLLYQERGSHQQAVGVLARAANDPEYALSTHFALGASYKELGQLKEAAAEFEQTIRLVDLESIGRAESEDLIQMYENAAGIYREVGDVARAASLYSTLASFLQSKRWGKERAAEFNRRAKELTEQNMFAKLRTLGTGALVAPAEQAPSFIPQPPQSETMPETWGKIRPITDFLRPGRGGGGEQLDPGFAFAPAAPVAPDPLAALEHTLPAEAKTFAPLTKLDTKGLDEQTERWVTASERYVEQGLLEAAIDACLEVIGLNVDYFPIHLRMGEIYERQERVEDALSKYQLLVDTLMVRGEQKQCIDVYYRLIDLSPDTINPRSRLAELLRAQGRNEEAADQLAMVASSYFRLGQTNKALEEYRRLLQWAPRSKELHTQYGLALLKLERYEAALAEFRRALELGADDPAAIARLSIALALIGEQPATVWDSLATVLEQVKAQPQSSGAVQAEYRSALLTTDEALLHYMLAIVQQRSGQHQSALLELEQAAALLEADEDPMLPAVLVHQALADSYIELGQAEEALEQLRRGHEVAGNVKPNPAIRHPFAAPLGRGDLVRRMAEAFAATDDLPGAEQALLEAKRLLPYDRTIYTKLADVYFRQGKLQDALAQLDDLATHYEGRQDLDKALETLEYALRLAPSSVPIGARQANMQIRRGYLDKGVENLVRVAELQRKGGLLKDAVASLQKAAEVHWTLGQHDAARAMYDKIVHIAPNDIEARQWLALMYTLSFRTADAIAEKKQIVRILAQQRDYDNAIAELHQIIGLNQKDIDAYFLLGDMLMRRAEYSQAVGIYNRMLKMEGVEKERLEALHAAASRMLAQQQAMRGT